MSKLNEYTLDSTKVIKLSRILLYNFYIHHKHFFRILRVSLYV